ncbi:DNA cytosine methyltransferase [Nocardia elegans]|uniref:DNA (cytosine-5-)-methyltransferase n=1 Tax=Nocardia elegans TaxID=300029 RepID=A0ABW6TNI2_9NOCA
MRIGSLFSGAGGLDLAALELFPDSSMAWHAEIDPAASKVLAHHWPDVPNLGDVMRVGLSYSDSEWAQMKARADRDDDYELPSPDWSKVEPVDVLTAGFPCQDVSLAGLRKGLASGTRSGLWAYVATAIAALRPRIVLIENVKGLLSATAVRDMESGSGSVGDGGGRPVLRALGAVLGDLASLGFDADWRTLRASDMGACHRRERVFILAYPAEHRPERVGAGPATRGVPSGVTKLLPTPQVADATGGHKTRSGARSNELLLPGVAEAYASGKLLPTLRASDGSGGPNPLSRPERQDDVETRVLRLGAEWGEYEAAIKRQEALSRPAPAPTVANLRGNHRLSPAFAEWMMWWPAGWVD